MYKYSVVKKKRRIHGSATHTDAQEGKIDYAERTGICQTCPPPYLPSC